MESRVLPAINELGRIIDDLSSNLRKYVKKEDANELYVQKQNEQILHLTNLYNCLMRFKYLESWEMIESRLINLESIDPQLNAHTIVLHTKPGEHCNYSYIEINPFKS